MLTAFVTSPPSSAATTCSATITPARSCASSVDAARCGVTTTLSSPSSGPEYGSEEKTSSAAAATLPERSASSSAVLVDELAARRVDETHAVAHLREGVGPDRVPRVRRERKVQGHEVGVGVQLVRRLHVLGAELAEAILRDERVVRDDAHLQPERTPRDLLADAPEAEDAERLSGELDARRSATAPSALPRARRAPAGCCARARAAGPSCARRRR